MSRRLFIPMLCLAASVLAVGCTTPRQHNLPPAERLARPGPGVDGPGPGVIPPSMPPGVMPMYGPPVQVLFNRPGGMQVRFDVGGHGHFDSEPIVAPGRTNFPVGGIYRLKLTSITGKEGVELYPTLEIGPVTPRTGAFLEHNAIPVQFTDEDIEQVLTGNYVTKVIYLPDPEFAELALAGVDTLVSTRLDAGVEPIVEADRRGAILAIVRLGNKDLEMGGAIQDGAVVPAQYGVPVGHGAAGGHHAPGSGLPMAMAPSHLGPKGAIGSPPMHYGGHGAHFGPTPQRPGTLSPPYIAGVTAPGWGMPYVGTPIGLPGPPHIPHGGPAGLTSHVMHNHTRYNIPPPTHHLNIHVQKRPGYSYPRPPSNAFIRTDTIHPAQPVHNNNRFRMIK